MKNIKWIILGIVIVGIVMAGAAAYAMAPKYILGKAIKKFEGYKSFRAEYIAPGEYASKVKLKAEINTDGKDLSRVVLDVGGTLKADLVVNSKNAYAQLALVQAEEAEKQIKVAYPMLLEMETYKLIRPVILGESYLHFDIPESSKSAMKKEDLPESYKKLAKSWGNIYLLKSLNPFYNHEGQIMTRMVLGMNKNKLVEAIDKIKDSDLDIKVSQVNAMRKVVTATNGWENDLIEVIIDRQGNLRVVKVRMPQPPKEAISENLADTVPSTNKNLISGLQALASKYAPTETKLVDFGGIYFNDFNQEIKIEAPNKLVEMKKLLEVGQKELAPMIAAAITGKPIPLPTPTPKKAATTTTKRTLSASCPAIYKLTSGPIRGEKCFQPADAAALDKVVKEENALVSSAMSKLKSFGDRCKNGDQGACSEGQSFYNQTLSQMNSYEQQARTIFAKGW